MTGQLHHQQARQSEHFLLFYPRNLAEVKHYQQQQRQTSIIDISNVVVSPCLTRKSSRRNEQHTIWRIERSITTISILNFKLSKSCDIIQTQGYKLVDDRLSSFGWGRVPLGCKIVDILTILKISSNPIYSNISFSAFQPVSNSSLLQFDMLVFTVAWILNLKGNHWSYRTQSKMKSYCRIIYRII